ncbi:ankyrin, partial [Piromyces finnis]
MNNKNKDLNLPGYGFTPLILSYLLHNQEVFELLLQHKDINELDTNGYSILHYVIMIEDIETLNCLIKMGADPNYKEENNKRGNSALDIAISIKNKDIFNILIDCPQIELNCPDWRGETSLMTTIKLNHIELQEKVNIIKILIEKGSDVNFIDTSKNNALIYAVNE